MSNSNILLIDGDILIYQQSCANQLDIEWGRGLKTSLASLENAQAAIIDIVAKYEKDLKAKWTYICMGSGRGKTFRHKINPTYKFNRVGTVRPQLRHPLAQWVIETFKTIKWPCVEGDDVMGVMATGPMLAQYGSPIIVSADKDMRQIPGRLFNPRHPELGVQSIDLREADWAFYRQILTGDPTDGYAGIPGIGPKKAEKILAEAEDGEPHEFWRIIVEAYEKAGMTEADAMLQARMARILRWEDYDYDKKEVKLWQPPK